MCRQPSGDNCRHQHSSLQPLTIINAADGDGPSPLTSGGRSDLNEYTSSLGAYTPSSWQQDRPRHQSIKDNDESVQRRAPLFDQVISPCDKVMSIAKPPNIVERKHHGSVNTNTADLQYPTFSSSQRTSSTTSRHLRRGNCGHRRDEETEPEVDTKREKFLERNRVAASKCRRKKKEWTDGLEEKLRHLQAENSHLRSLRVILKEDVLSLRGEMLRHQCCGCYGIRSYLANYASKLAYEQQLDVWQEGDQQYALFTSPTNSSMSGSPMRVQSSISAAQAQPMQNDPGSTGLSRGVCDRDRDHQQTDKSTSVVSDEYIDETFEGFFNESLNPCLATMIAEESNVQAAT